MLHACARQHRRRRQRPDLRRLRAWPHAQDWQQITCLSASAKPSPHPRPFPPPATPADIGLHADRVPKAPCAAPSLALTTASGCGDTAVSSGDPPVAAAVTLKSSPAGNAAQLPSGRSSVSAGRADAEACGRKGFRGDPRRA